MPLDFSRKRVDWGNWGSARHTEYVMNGVLGQRPEYVAPTGAKSSFSVWFYRDAAPTALPAKIRGRLGAA